MLITGFITRLFNLPSEQSDFKRGSDMKLSLRMLATGAALALVTMLLVAPPASAQESEITGRVVAAATGEPISGAHLSIAELNLMASTDATGRYRLTDIPSGQHVIRVRMIGYEPERHQVTVSPDTTMTVDIALAVSAISLEHIVVTATGEERARAIGYSAGVIAADEIMESAPIRDLSDLLAERTPGVTVQASSGTVGSGSPVRIRGSSSLATSNQPIVYVDGTRVNVDPANLTVRTGGQQTGALNINPEDIESIEVLRGASAATLYGTDAATGIIRIRTKSGSGIDEGTEWRVGIEGGVHTEPGGWPANWEGVSSEGTVCPLVSVAAGLCTQDILKSFNQLENRATTPFSTGQRWKLGGSARGGSGDFNYYGSGEYEVSQGVYGTNNELRSANVRGNFGVELSENVWLKLNTGYMTRNVTLPQNDNNLTGILANLLLAGADEGDFFLVSLDEILSIDTQKQTRGFVGSADLDWVPLEWLTVNATLGANLSNDKDQQLFPVGGVSLGQLPLGERSSNAILYENYTGDMFVQGNLPLSSSLESQTTVGFQLFADRVRTVFATGEELTPGTSSVSAAARTTAGEETTEARTVGAFVQQRINMDDRLFFTTGFRVDNNSAFGTDFGMAFYPSANVSWVISEETWFDPGEWLDQLRFRGAVGLAGNRPGTTDALAFFRSVPVTDVTGAERTGVTFQGGNVGNRELKPERTTEVELGFDADLLSNQLTVSATYYHSRTSDVLVARTLAPSLGVTEQRLVNLGKSRNEGVEGQIRLLLDWNRTRLSLNFTGSYNDNKLVELGEGVAPIQDSEIVWHHEGFPLGGYWDRPFTFDDENGDGLIAPSEITVGDTAVFLGSPYPPWQLTATPTLTLFDRVELRSHWSAKLGHQQYNKTESLRCLIGSARGRHDPGASLEDQAGCLAAGQGMSKQGMVGDASFLRLQELSVGVQAPQAWAAALRARSLALTVSGRNLALWTGYEGIDPDSEGRSLGFLSGDELTQPPLRFWNARIRVVF